MIRFARSLRVAALVLGGGAALSACSHGPSAAPPPATPSTNAVAGVASYDKVIAALQRGDTDHASKMLKTMLAHDPGDMRARHLSESIDIDPVAMLGSRSFAYTIKPGDTLLALADKYLGDADRFYALARYNHIAMPDAIKPGDTIRIPGTPPGEQAAPEAHVEHPVPHRAPPVAAAPVKPAAPAATAAPRANPALAAKFRAAGLGALNRGDLNRAVAYLSHAAALDPDNALIKRDLARAERIRATVQARR